MEVYLKIPGTRISPVGGQPPGRSCVESPRGLDSYGICQINGCKFSLLVVATPGIKVRLVPKLCFHCHTTGQLVLIFWFMFANEAANVLTDF
jgi:hypothetical protein